MGISSHSSGGQLEKEVGEPGLERGRGGETEAWLGQRFLRSSFRNDQGNDENKNKHNTRTVAPRSCTLGSAGRRASGPRRSDLTKWAAGPPHTCRKVFTGGRSVQVASTSP